MLLPDQGRYNTNFEPFLRQIRYQVEVNSLCTTNYKPGHDHQDTLRCRAFCQVIRKNWRITDCFKWRSISQSDMWKATTQRTILRPQSVTLYRMV